MHEAKSILLQPYSSARMKLRNTLFVLVFLYASCFSAFGQTAKSVLDETSVLLQSCGDIEASFHASQFNGTQEVGSTQGTIFISGNKFKIQTTELTSWFDGSTLWNLLAGSDEVNISTPTSVELQRLNPYFFVNLYKSGYNLSLSEVDYAGKSCHSVTLKAQSNSAEVQTLLLTIDKTSKLPLSIRLKDKKGDWFRVRVSNVHTGKSFKASTFQFNEKDYPGIEVIDLR